MAHNNEQALVPAPAQVLMRPRLMVYLYITTELHRLCVKMLPAAQDHRLEGDDFMKHVDVATTDEEKGWMNDFLTADEINVASTEQGLSVMLIDKYENMWALRLKRNDEDHSYNLSGRSFRRFKIRQRFTPGWIFHLWVARSIVNEVIMAMDFMMGNRH